MSVIQIVPKISPAIDGVGDYALNLARQIRKDFNIQTHFIVGNPTWIGPGEIEGFAINQVSASSDDALLTLLSEIRPCTILLHYVGYGYAQRGCPIWLVDGLQRWKALSPQHSQVTMFHEVYASGPPWTSAFWLSTRQKNLAARLAQMSDNLITSKQFYAEILTNLSKGKHTEIPALPVFSNIGEPDKLSSLSERQKRLVIFGGVANRGKVYRDSRSIIESVCHKLGIQEIWDVGTSTGLGISSIGQVPVLEVGQQPAKKISEILADSIAGFMDYNPDFLGKSTIFASYCAHQLIPINANSSTSVIDGIEPGKHYWAPQKSELGNEVEMQGIANNAYSWYQTHNLSIQAKTFTKYLIGNLKTQLIHNL